MGTGNAPESRGEYRKAQVMVPQHRGALFPICELNASSCRDANLLEIDMKTIVSGLIALSVLIAITPAASAKPQCSDGRDWPYCKPSQPLK